MALMTHEAAELNELLLSCTNSINSMGFFINNVKCQELKGILQKHMTAHVQDYNMKVEWATKGSSQQKLTVPLMPAKMNASTQAQMQLTTPDPKATAFDDRAIATNYLLTLKRAGREYAWATFETSDPQLRSFLEDAFTMCSRHSFEVSEYFAKKGWYPSEVASQTLLQKYQQTYAQVQEMAGVH